MPYFNTKALNENADLLYFDANSLVWTSVVSCKAGKSHLCCSCSICMLVVLHIVGYLQLIFIVINCMFDSEDCFVTFV